MSTAPTPSPHPLVTPSLEPGDQASPGTPGTGEAICPRCGGSGRLDGGACPECGGKGKVVIGVGGG